MTTPKKIIVKKKITKTLINYEDEYLSIEGTEKEARINVAKKFIISCLHL